MVDTNQWNRGMMIIRIDSLFLFLSLLGLPRRSLWLYSSYLISLRILYLIALLSVARTSVDSCSLSVSFWGIFLLLTLSWSEISNVTLWQWALSKSLSTKSHACAAMSRGCLFISCQMPVTSHTIYVTLCLSPSGFTDWAGCTNLYTTSSCILNIDPLCLPARVALRLMLL